MSDEAVIRIILQDGSGGGSQPPPPASTPSGSPPSGSPPPPTQSGTSSHPPRSPSPPPAGSRQVPVAQQVLVGGVPQQAGPPAGSTMSQSRPHWVNDLIEGITKSVKDLAVQLTSAKLQSSGKSTPQSGGILQGLQPLQQAQTSLPQLITSIPPIFSPPAGAAHSSQSPSSSITYSPAATSLSSSSSALTLSAGSSQSTTTSAGSNARSEAAKRAAETRRRNQEEIYAEINRGRLDETVASEGSKKYVPIETELAEKRKTRSNELRKERYRKKREAEGKTVRSRKVKNPTTAATSDLDEVTESLGMGKAVVETDLTPDEKKNTPDLSWPTGSTLSGGGKLPRMVSSGKLPRLAGGTKGWFSKIFGAGQKEQPSKSAQVSSSNFDPATWGKNNQLIDILRNALTQAGYTPKDASAISSDRDILEVWKMNAPHLSATEALAKLRKSGVLRYGPYDAPHFMREFEKHKDKQATALGQTLEEITDPELQLSIPSAPAAPLSGVKYDKHGRIITSRKGKKPPLETDVAGSAGKALPLTRKRPKPFFKSGEDSTDLPELPPGLFSGGGRIPRMAGGGQVETPVGKAYVPTLSASRKKLLGEQAKVEFVDPYYKTDPNTLLGVYQQNNPMALPPGADTADLPKQFFKDWADISRLMPEATASIKRIKNVPVDQRKSTGATFTPNYVIDEHDRPEGTLAINPNDYKTEYLWHELVHAEQHKRGELQSKARLDMTTGKLSEHGRLIESEAYQRGMQGEEVVNRLRLLLAKEEKKKKGWWWQDHVPARSGGGDIPPMAIVGDLPGQSLDSIKSDPHTEVIVGNQVVPHNEALRHGLFDGGLPQYATGTQNNLVPVPQRPPLTPPPDYAGNLSGMMGNSGGMSAAGGPAGMIVEIVKMATAAAIGANKAIIGGAGSVANWAASGPNVGGDIERFGGAVANAGESLSKISPIAGVVVNAFGETGKALGSFMQAMDKTVERYGEVNPAIAQQQAIGEIRQVMGDMRRGREGEADIVRYMQVQQDLQQKFEDQKMKILTKILAVVNPILEIIEKVIPMGEGAANAIEMLLIPIQAMANAINIIANVQRDNQIQPVQDPADILLNYPNADVGLESAIGR